MEKNFDDIIKKALEIYDSHQNRYENMKEEKPMLSIDSFQDSELLGYYDNENKIWVWGWALPTMFREKNPLCAKLLDYGLDINNDEHYFIKSLLLNSRISVDNSIQLDINLAICTYILKETILFIYPEKVYLDDNKNKYITNYHLIKKNI